MNKLPEPVIVCKFGITREMKNLLQKEANLRTNGKITPLVRDILAERYKIKKQEGLTL